MNHVRITSFGGDTKALILCTREQYLPGHVYKVPQPAGWMWDTIVKWLTILRSSFSNSSSMLLFSRWRISMCAQNYSVLKTASWHRHSNWKDLCWRRNLPPRLRLCTRRISERGFHYQNTYWKSDSFCIKMSSIFVLSFFTIYILNILKCACGKQRIMFFVKLLYVCMC